jgi:hypothetical protein
VDFLDLRGNAGAVLPIFLPLPQQQPEHPAPHCNNSVLAKTSITVAKNVLLRKSVTKTSKVDIFFKYNTKYFLKN